MRHIIYVVLFRNVSHRIEHAWLEKNHYGGSREPMIPARQCLVTSAQNEFSSRIEDTLSVITIGEPARRDSGKVYQAESALGFVRAGGLQKRAREAVHLAHISSPPVRSNEQLWQKSCDKA